MCSSSWNRDSPLNLAYLASRAASFAHTPLPSGPSAAPRVIAILPGAGDTQMLWENRNTKRGADKTCSTDADTATSISQCRS